MVGYEKEADKLQQWQYMFAGGASGAITRCVAQPLDVLKIRFQLQVEPIAVGSKYSSIGQALQVILKEESFAALWSGHIPAQYLSISYGVAQFWAYEILTEKCYKSQTSIPTPFVPLINFSCGAIAGSFATVISFPFDTVRTRLIAEEKNFRVYRGVWHTLYHMYSVEGRLAMFKGLLPTIAQIAPHSGAQFMFYNIFNVYFLSFYNSKESGSFVSSFSAGSMAGFLAKLTIYPFDLAKKRLQIQGFQSHRHNFGKQFYCKGFLNCITHTVKTEGFKALYKGLVPSLMKAMIVSALHFTCFEVICQHFQQYNNP